VCRGILPVRNVRNDPKYFGKLCHVYPRTVALPLHLTPWDTFITSPTHPLIHLGVMCRDAVRGCYQTAWSDWMWESSLRCEPAQNVLTAHLVHPIRPGCPGARANIVVVDSSCCATELHQITRLGRSRQVSLSRRATPNIWTWLRRGCGIASQHPNPAEIEGSHRESTGYDTYGWVMWLAWTRTGVLGPRGDLSPCRLLGQNCPLVPMDQRPCPLHACTMPQPYGHLTCMMHSRPAITGLTKPVGACGSPRGGQ